MEIFLSLNGSRELNSHLICHYTALRFNYRTEFSTALWLRNIEKEVE